MKVKIDRMEFYVEIDRDFNGEFDITGIYTEESILDIIPGKLHDRIYNQIYDQMAEEQICREEDRGDYLYHMRKESV